MRKLARDCRNVLSWLHCDDPIQRAAAVQVFEYAELCFIYFTTTLCCLLTLLFNYESIFPQILKVYWENRQHQPQNNQEGHGKENGERRVDIYEYMYFSGSISRGQSANLNILHCMTKINYLSIKVLMTIQGPVKFIFSGWWLLHYNHSHIIFESVELETFYEFWQIM